jgi:hypothetical protein
VAIVVADAVLWNGAKRSLAESFAATASVRDLLGRGLTFRMVAEAAGRRTPARGASRAIPSRAVSAHVIRKPRPLHRRVGAYV